MRALVTGGAGFIGHHIVRALRSGGHEVSVLDNFMTGDARRLDALRGQITLVEGTILDSDSVDEAMRGCDVAFHLAALPSVARSVEDPRLSNEINTSGTIEVMQAAGRHRVRRVVFAGSSSVYGDSLELPRRESQMPAPRSPYAASKLAAEHYVHSLGALNDVETVVLRYFNIFGPGQDPASEYAAVVPKFVTAVLRGERPTVYGTGETSRDFTHVDNAVAANLQAATVPGISGLTCNVGCGSRYTLLELLEAIGKAAGTEPEPKFGPPRPGDVPDSLADIALAEQRLGYRVVVPFADGIVQTVAWFRAQLSDASPVHDVLPTDR